MSRDEHYKGLIDRTTFKSASNTEDLFQLYRKEDIDELMSNFSVERLHYHFSICERPDMVGATHHILDVFRKVTEH